MAMRYSTNHHPSCELEQLTNIHNFERFGAPPRSLFASSGVLLLRLNSTITDAKGNIEYNIRSKFISLRDRTIISDCTGNTVAHFEKKILSIRQQYFVSMADGSSFELSDEHIRLINGIASIAGLNWKLCGNIYGLDFELYDQEEQIIAVISRKTDSIHFTYCIDIYRPESEKTVIAIFVTLQHMTLEKKVSSPDSSVLSSYRR